MATPAPSDLDGACRSFLAAAFPILTEDHVIPPPAFRRYLQVGRDYFGHTIMPLAEFKSLIGLLDKDYPHRFVTPPRHEREYASTYVFAFLEACIARCAIDSFDISSDAVTTSIHELRQVLDSDEIEVAAVRYVAHCTTITGEPIEIGDIRVVPDTNKPGSGRQFMWRILREEIPCAPALAEDLDRNLWDPPHALLITRGLSKARTAEETVEILTDRIDRFLFLARLLTAGSVRSSFQVHGPTTMTAGTSAHLRSYPISGRLWTQRPVRLRGDEQPAFTALGELIDAAEVKREGMFATSFDVALRRFNSSHSGEWSDQLVDLATALEATMIGADSGTEAITLKLQTRVATLLVASDDPANDLFSDVGRLYDIRSKLVHGGQIRLEKHQKREGLRQIIQKVSTVPEGLAADRIAVAVELAVDRLRDIVRRAILARLCLAETPNPLWPFNNGKSVEAELVVDANRTLWRDTWRNRLAELGVASAADKASPPTDPMSSGNSPLVTAP